MAGRRGNRAINLETRFESYMEQALKLDKFDRWEEGWQWLEKAKKLIDDAVFDAKRQYQQRVFYEMGRIHARMGRYQDAIQMLKDALSADPRDNSAMKAKIHGELGTIYRYQGDSSNAQEAFKDQYRLAYEMSVEAEAEMCSSVGNEGMAALSRYQLSGGHDEGLLKDASLQIQERVSLAGNLWARLDKDEISSVMRQRYSEKQPEKLDNLVKNYKEKCEIWQIEGNDRLSLCYIEEATKIESRDAAKAKELRGQALEVAKVSQALQDKRKSLTGEEDVNVRALSLYFYGNALYVNGRTEEALTYWNAKKGVKGPAHVLCKQPAAEHVLYVKRMARAGALFVNPDEQDLTPLDYAHLSFSRNSQEMVNTIKEECLRPRLLEHHLNQSLHSDPFGPTGPPKSEEQIAKEVEKRIQGLCRDAELRRCFRDVLQEKIRPILLSKSKVILQEIRQTYAQALAQDKKKQQYLDWFYYLRYEDFVKAKRLPHAEFDRDLVSAQQFNVSDDETENKDLFIIFFSYRWIGRHSNKLGPDDTDNSQYKRMLQAVSTYLSERRDLDPKNVGIWLDYACISQEYPDRKEKGINALPLAVAQCDVVISLVDDDYYSRAWCAVEVRLSRELLGHSHHEWREHILNQPENNLVNGALLARDEKPPDDSELGPGVLSFEALDRPKVDFLIRQAKLLAPTQL